MIKRILLIDDDRDDAEIFSDALSEVDPATGFNHIDDGLVAVSLLSADGALLPDIIFLDINMPSINGWECLQEIKKHPVLRPIPVIMYSTSNPGREGTSAADAGAAGFMTKPNTFRELKAMLARILSGKKEI